MNKQVHTGLQSKRKGGRSSASNAELEANVGLGVRRSVELVHQSGETAIIALNLKKTDYNFFGKEKRRETELVVL